jgi:hypothetical protein
MAMLGTYRWARVAGFAAGLAAVAVLVAGLQVGRGAGTVGADVTFVATPTGELAIPTGPFVKGIGLQPGAGADGALPVRNQTGRTLAVSVRVLPSIRDLDRVLRVRMTAGGRPIYVGPLGGLRTWSRPFHLASGTATELGVQVDLPGGSAAEAHGRIDDISLAFRSVPVGGGS